MFLHGKCVEIRYNAYKAYLEIYELAMIQFFFWGYSFFLVVIVLVGAYWIGWNITGRNRYQEAFYTHPLILIWIGIYIQGLVLLFLGYFKAYDVRVLAFFLFLPLLGCYFQRKECVEWWRSARCRTKIRWSTVVMDVLWFIIPFSVFFLFPFFYDTLHYHYAHPIYWLLNKGIVPLGPSIKGATPLIPRLHYLLGFGLSDWTYPAILYMCIGFLFILTVRALGDELGWGKTEKRWSHLLVLTAPAFWQQSFFRGDDLFVAWAGAIFLLMLMRVWKKAQLTSREAFFFGLIGGFCAFVKYGGLTLWVVVAFVHFFMFSSFYKQEKAMWFKSGLITGIPFFGIVLVWLGHAWYMGGHPFYFLAPFLGRYSLHSTRWQAEFIRTLAEGQGFFADLIHQVHSFFQGGIFGLEGFYGVLILVGVLPGLFLREVPVLIKIWWIETALAYELTLRLPRYAFFMLGINVVLTVFTLQKIPWKKSVTFLIYIVGFLHIVLFFTNPWTRPVIRNAFEYVFAGQPNRISFIASTKACVYLNSLNPSDMKVLFVGETRYFPCRVPFIFWDPYYKNPIEHVHHGQSPEVFWTTYVKKEGVTHIVYTPGEAYRLFEWPASMHRRWQQWLQKHTRLIYRARDTAKVTYVFEIHFPDSDRKP